MTTILTTIVTTIVTTIMTTSVTTITAAAAANTIAARTTTTATTTTVMIRCGSSAVSTALARPERRKDPFSHRSDWANGTNSMTAIDWPGLEAGRPNPAPLAVRRGTATTPRIPTGRTARRTESKRRTWPARSRDRSPHRWTLESEFEASGLARAASDSRRSSYGLPYKLLYKKRGLSSQHPQSKQITKPR
eukprot:CAMPEP_0175079510 /NCGR_PEP_ID=MMETSP0052_2-20121109/24865_1 /TAXON_ID=51329 ORGANISM="Polytomella parva, Strain SAG 63-3" /NCGR_SAMPLE_ID=MMETSP0052_2 /ASSEMBLY_ACC=CAM_ASM_000194 /LENGTH=190 /DNA_ID=CAMNT_0016349853 /DNA_START=497 /DNA_END=1064 /DNA_ORIENTATION=+